MTAPSPYCGAPSATALAGLLARGSVAVAFGAVMAGSALAQAKSVADTAVPPGYRPPAGMCRVWVDGVPAQQQPAPTDCQTAMRSRPTRSRVLIGDRPPADAGMPVSAFNAGSAAYSNAPGARMGRLAELDEPLVKRAGQGELCLDADHDGVCDESAPLIASCLDANRDGKCDEPRKDVAALIDAGAFRAGSAMGGVCIDRNRDGKCDETWVGADVCLDRDGDGKCDPPVAAIAKPAEVQVKEAAPAAPKGRKKP